LAELNGHKADVRDDLFGVKATSSSIDPDGLGLLAGALLGGDLAGNRLRTRTKEKNRAIHFDLECINLGLRIEFEESGGSLSDSSRVRSLERACQMTTKSGIAGFAIEDMALKRIEAGLDSGINGAIGEELAQRHARNFHIKYKDIRS